MLKPIGDLILCERLESDKETAGGIFLPIPHQKSLAVVIDIGKGVLSLKTGEFVQYKINTGDIIIFETHRGHRAKYLGVNYLFVSMENVIAVHRKEDLVNGKMINRIDVESGASNFPTLSQFKS